MASPRLFSMALSGIHKNNNNKHPKMSTVSCMRRGTMNSVSPAVASMAPLLGSQEDPIKQRSKPIKHMFVMDLESTGLRPWEDRIVQVCFKHYAVPSEGIFGEPFGPLTRPPSDVLLGTFSEYVNPQGFPMNPRAAEVNKLSDTFLAGFEPFEHVGARLTQWLDNQREQHTAPMDMCYMVAHNGMAFDFPLLLQEMRRANLGTASFSKFAYFDTIIAMRKDPERKFDPETKRKEGVGMEAWHRREYHCPVPNAHQAEADVEALARLFFCGSNKYPRVCVAHGQVAPWNKIGANLDALCSKQTNENNAEHSSSSAAATAAAVACVVSAI